MRLFTALDPSPEVHDQLTRLLERLRPSAGVRWAKPENLHLTVKFIGEWPEERLPALRQALGGVALPPPFEVRIAKLGFFPNSRAPRVFWAGIHSSPALKELAAGIDNAVTPLGIALETRPYSPHLTLARVPERTPLEALHRAIESLPSAEFGTFTADRFFLYQSRPAAGGSIYTQIGEFPCGAY